jgi:hypothetical protein
MELKMRTLMWIKTVPTLEKRALITVAITFYRRPLSRGINGVKLITNEWLPIYI